MIFNVSVLQLVKEALDMLYDILCVSVRISGVYFPVNRFCSGINYGGVMISRQVNIETKIIDPRNSSP